MTVHRKGYLAEYFTVGWNISEGIVAIAAGILADSIALVGFGLDSCRSRFRPGVDGKKIYFHQHQEEVLPGLFSLSFP